MGLCLQGFELWWYGAVGGGGGEWGGWIGTLGERADSEVVGVKLCVLSGGRKQGRFTQ